ncbi:MAG: histidine--tRNA ligase [Candidatus Methylarchaceae archaeon HK01M]|nr:histidine--tRNA ligase [Candidatus Methylarchaceae archaeon HK01M]
MKFRLPRGMRDLEPEDFEVVEKIRSTFLEVSKLFGFKLMESSPIELLSTLEAKSGPAISEEIYCFKDKGGRDLGLRFDLTVGMTRFVASRRDLQLPIKLCSFSSMWRYDEPQYGRYRWFYQWDAEIFGSKSVEADVEIVDLTHVIFDKLGLKNCFIEIGDRKVVEEYVRREMKTDDEDLILEALRALDKIKKKSTSQIIEEYADKGIDEHVMRKIIEFGKIRGAPYKVIDMLEEKEVQNLKNLKSITDSLHARGIGGVFLSMGIVRGLDYYDGVVFEVFDEEHVDIGALAGGGRFDSLPSVFGRPDLLATGVAGGVERIILALSKRGLAKSKEEQGMIYVAYANKDFIKQATRLASDLRRSGVRVEADLSGRSLKKQMEVASSLRARYVLIIAPREYSQKEIVLKNMGDGTERRIGVDEVVPFLKAEVS